MEIKKELHRFWSKNKFTIIVIGIFGLYFTMYSLLNMFCKAARSDCDMVLYYQMAYSIFRGEGIKHFGVDCNYISVMYPLLMSPFFCIRDPALRIQSISILNSFLVSSCVFPLYLISKKIIKNRNYQLVFVFLAMLLPFTAESIDFGMVEPLYYPLLLWLFYLFLINLKKQNYLLSFFGAILTEVCFLSKYVALCFFVAVIILPFIVYLAKKFKDSDTRFLDIFSKKVSINLAIYGFAFLTIFFVFKYCVFNKFDPLVNYFKITSWEKFGYFFYSLIHIICAMAMTTFIVPVVVPWFFLNKMKKEHKDFYLLLIIFFIVNALVISLLIYVNEDLGKIDPRDLARYYMGASPLLILYVFLLLENKKFISKKELPKVKLTLIISLVVFCLVFKGTGQERKDSEGFFFYGWIEKMLENAHISGFLMFFVVFLVNIALSVAIYFFFAFLISDKSIKFNKKEFKWHIATLMAVVLFVPSTIIGIMDYRDNTSMNPLEIPAIKNIDNFIEQNGELSFLILTRNAISVGMYGNYHTNSIVCVSPQFQNDMNTIHKEVLPTNEYTFLTPRYNYKYPKMDKIDYIFMHTRVKFSTFNMTELTKIEFDGKDLWYLYRNNDPANLHFQFL